MDNKELNDNLFGNSSISIVLKQFKEEHISESEAIQLIEDLYRYNTSYWPQITWETPNFPNYEVTCNKQY